MPQSVPVSAADYYDFFPTADHHAGDVWVNLPTFGLLAGDHVPGLVVTPACDLQNCKTDTITYLPILPVRQAFLTRGFLPEILRTIDGQLQLLGLQALSGSGDRYAPIALHVFVEVAERIRAERERRRFGDKEISAAARISSGMSILRIAIGPARAMVSAEDLCQCFGESSLEKIVERMVTNGYRTDIHFLPPDGQPSEWSVISDPSLCLFRYPISAPIEIFDAAQDLTKKDWGAEIVRISAYTPGARAFAFARPMKRQTLKPRFFADLITRYVSMHVRIGAPDFTDESIGTYVAQVSKGKA